MAKSRSSLCGIARHRTVIRVKALYRGTPQGFCVDQGRIHTALGPHPSDLKIFHSPPPEMALQTQRTSYFACLTVLKLESNSSGT